MEAIFEIKELIEDGRSPFAEWFNSLDAVTAARVDKYIRRLETGNFSAAKALREGVFELNWILAPVTGFISARRQNDYYFIGRRQQTPPIRRHRSRH